MRALLSGVFWRYFAIFIQFLIILGVARRLDFNDAAVYFSLFGVVGVFFTLSGAGIPDGLVRFLPLLDSRNAKSAGLRLVRQGIIATLALNSLIAVPLAVVALRLLGQSQIGFAPLLAIWWFAYAGVFLGGQVLVALNRPGFGAFFAYSSINIGYLVSLLPYLILAEAPSLKGALLAAIVGASGALLAAMLMVFRVLGASQNPNPPPSPQNPAEDVRISEVLSVGVKMLLARMMQASLPWIPVWFLLAFDYPGQSANYAAASRLIVAVTSVVAALRFSARNDIVRMYEQGNYRGIVRLNRQVSLLSFVPPALALILLFFIGDWIVPLVLGNDYAPVVPILMILIVGVLAEAFGGLSDEILKMTGRTSIVLWSLGTGLVVQIALVALLVDEGALAVAWATVAAFAIQYVWQVFWLSIHTPIRLIGRKRQ